MSSRGHLAAVDLASPEVPEAIESEKALVGLLVRGLHCADVRAALPRPETCHRRDHQLIAQEAYALMDRGVVPDARLIDMSVGALLDSRAGLYAVADAALRLTPETIAEHGRRVAITYAGRRLAGRMERALSELRESPGSTLDTANDVAALIADIQRETGAAASTAQPITVLLEDQLDTLSAQPWIIDQILPGGVTGIVAAPGAGKTTTAFSLAVAIASDVDRWCGRAVVGRSPVFMVLAEGAPNAGARLRAAKITQGVSPSNTIGIAVVPHPVNFFEGGRDYQAFRDLVSDTNAIVVADTLNLTAIGADENSAADMTRVLANMRNLNARAVVFLHHLGVNGGRERGSSAIRANCDALLTLIETDDMVTLSCEKMRDGAPFEPLRLKLFEVPETGACSVRLASEHRPAGDLSPAQQQALAGLLAGFPAGSGGATRSEWHALVPTMKERTFYHAVGRLHTLGFVTERTGRFTPSGTSA